jgi:nucleoside-diphosphate-sugar epimerase
MSKQNLLLFGVGWLGKALVRSLSTKEVSITIATTNKDKWDQFDVNISIIEVSLDSKELSFANTKIDINSFDQIIVMLPPSGFEDYAEVVQGICSKLESSKQLIFTSSTGVYQNIDTVVNENGSINQAHPVYKAEEVIRNSFKGHYSILRLAGLLGGDRHPVKYLLNKENIPNGKAPVNLIHRDDVIGAIKVLLYSSSSNSTYNICYPDHPTKKDYYEDFALRLYGRSLNFNNGGKGKVVDGSKFVKKYDYQYLNPIWDVLINK